MNIKQKVGSRRRGELWVIAHVNGRGFRVTGPLLLSAQFFKMITTKMIQTYLRIRAGLSGLLHLYGLYYLFLFLFVWDI